MKPSVSTIKFPYQLSKVELKNIFRLERDSNIATQSFTAMGIWSQFNSHNSYRAPILFNHVLVT